MCSQIPEHPTPLEILQHFVSALSGGGEPHSSTAAHFYDLTALRKDLSDGQLTNAHGGMVARAFRTVDRGKLLYGHSTLTTLEFLGLE